MFFPSPLSLHSAPCIVESKQRDPRLWPFSSLLRNEETKVRIAAGDMHEEQPSAGLEPRVAVPENGVCLCVCKDMCTQGVTR